MKKKIAGFICAIASVALIASCGSSSGGGSAAAEAAAENSMVGFANILTSTACEPVFLAGAGTCDCSGGGSITVVDVTAALVAKDTFVGTATNCVDDTTNLTYNGTITVDDTTFQATANFTQFGECTNVLGTVSMADECDGQITGTCAGGTYICTLIDGTGDYCECQ